MLLILYDAKNMLKIAYYKMYLKYLTGDRNQKRFLKNKVS